MEAPTLVTAQWLKEQFIPSGQQLPSNIRLLDASWIANKDGHQLYQQEHIPSALHFDLEKITTPKEGCLHKKPIPTAKEFKEYIESLGVSNNTYIIIYDGTKYRPSFRSWFLFRLFGHDKISVLNGGLAYWKSLGYPTTQEEPDVTPGTFEINFRPSLLRDFDSVKTNLNSKTEQVMDSRGADLFRGAEDGSGGHIPGAKNIPFTSLTTEDGMFKEGKQLKDLFDGVNLDLSRQLVTHCGTSMSACSLAAAAHILGNKTVAVYNGAFAEWNILASDLIEKST